MNKLIAAATLAAASMVHVTAASAVTLCAKTGAGSATVTTPIKGSTTACKSGETAFQTEPPAHSAVYRSGHYGSVSAKFEQLSPSLETAVAEAGTYVVMASGLLQYTPGTVNDDATVQCRIMKRNLGGSVQNVLSTTSTVQTIKKGSYDHLATTASGYFNAGESPVLVCQQWSAATWKSVTIQLQEAKLTAVKVSKVLETVVQYDIIN